jgi:ParB-like chromosome segregation protein Spo0J
MTKQLEFTPKVREFNVAGKEKIEMFPLELLPPNEEFLRGKVDPDTFRSIKANGQLYPIILGRLTNGDPVIVDGEQRVKIQRRLNAEEIPVIWYPEQLNEFEVGMLRTHLNEARQENPVSNIEAIRKVLDKYPSTTAKGIQVMTGIKLGKVKSLMKQAKMPKVFIDAVSEGTMSKDTLADLSKKPRSIQKKAEVKYRDGREGLSVTKNEDTGGMEFKRLSDGHIYASPPILLSKNDVKDFQRVSVENKVTQAPMSLTVDFQETVEGFAVVQKDKFLTDLLETADEARLEIGRKKNCVVVHVVSI